MAIKRVGVVGCGLMGSGIAQVCAAAGFETVVREVAPEVVERGLKGIDKNLARLVEKGTISEAQKKEIRGRLSGTTAIEDLKDCDLVIEAIIEQLPAKRELFAKLDTLCGPATIFASNTSSLTITEISTATKRPQSPGNRTTRSTRRCGHIPTGSRDSRPCRPPTRRRPPTSWSAR